MARPASRHRFTVTENLSENGLSFRDHDEADRPPQHRHLVRVTETSAHPRFLSQWWPRCRSGATICSRLNSPRPADYLETSGSAGERTPTRWMKSGVMLGSISSA